MSCLLMQPLPGPLTAATIEAFLEVSVLVWFWVSLGCKTGEKDPYKCNSKFFLSSELTSRSLLSSVKCSLLSMGCPEFSVA